MSKRKSLRFSNITKYKKCFKKHIQKFVFSPKVIYNKFLKLKFKILLLNQTERSIGL